MASHSHSHSRPRSQTASIIQPHPYDTRSASEDSAGSHSHGHTHGDDSDGHSHDGGHGHSHAERERNLIKLSIAVTATFMLVEIFVGYQFSALSLVADSYHMLNDIAAFIVQLYASELGELERKKTRSISGFSYGFGRTQFVANLVNGCMLLALCLTLTLEGMQRFYSPEHITLPPLVLGIGCIALVWNVTMFFMFSEGHGGHSHSHSMGHEFSAMHPSAYRQAVTDAGIAHRYNLYRRTAPSSQLIEHAEAKSSKLSRKERKALDDHRARVAVGKRTDNDIFSFVAQHKSDDRVKANRAARSALAVHAIGDAAGNLAVIFDGAMSWMLGPKSGVISGQVTYWKGIGYVDPICTLVVIYVILKHSFPLVTASSYALMQAVEPLRINRYRRALEDPGQWWVPKHIRERCRAACIDVHVWQLAEKVSYATVKLVVSHKDHHPSSASTFTDADLESLVHDVKLRIFNNLSVCDNADYLIPPENITVEVELPPNHARSAPSSSRRSSVARSDSNEHPSTWQSSTALNSHEDGYGSSSRLRGKAPEGLPDVRHSAFEPFGANGGSSSGGVGRTSSRRSCMSSI